MTQRQRIIIAQQQRLALNTSLHTSIQLLRGDTAGLTRYLEEQAADNPHLRLIGPEAPAIGDWLPRWSGSLSYGNRSAMPPPEAAAAAPSLIAHVVAAIQSLKLPRDSHRIALALTEALEPSGWLGRSLADIARDTHSPPDAVEAVLAQVQKIEPPGIFARNLAECLGLQAAEIGALDREMTTILANLDLLAAGDTARLARLCRCDEAGVVARFRLIRAMNPKPGSDFAAGQPATMREPDLLARPLKDGRWSVTLNRSALPDLEVVAGEKTNVDKDALQAARSLQHMLKARNSTLLKVGCEIAARQVAALIQGASALAPMTMADVARAVGLHESTVSRIVAGASLDSPRGVWWLRRMFSGARGGQTAEGAARPQMAAAALRHRIGQIIAGENGTSPLSDKDLADLLEQETGVALARRTVAKYRESEGIPPAHRRRKSAPGRAGPTPAKARADGVQNAARD